MGFPIFDALNRPVGACALFSHRKELFSREDEWWLTIASNLIGNALKMGDMEQQARPASPLAGNFVGNNTAAAAGDEPQPSRRSKGAVLVIDDDRSFNHVICDFPEG
ncbi:MAG: hypothetical protein WKF84_29845 [Pyrinomonadaceae bacterium]